ncbi:MAG: MobF family relaxase [Tepidisphaeraceae bacterium]
MLRITQQTSATAARSYYSSADYFTENREVAGVWRGKGAALLGLEGTIEQKDWDALCLNRDPRIGKQLTARHNEHRRVGWDLTFSLPKSASLLYALTQDQRILDAFADSVDQTMEDIERDLATRVRVGKQNRDRPTGNGVWGRFIHTTSRPVDGIPDCHVHAHCFLQNLTMDVEEDRWKAVQIAQIKRDGNFYDALMHARMAARLVELGVPVERTAKSWRIAGFDSALEQKFSRRTRQIDEAAERLGITDPDEKAALGAITRDGKNKKLSLDELRATWLSWLTPDESDVIQRTQQALHDRVPVPFDPSAAREALDHASSHHFEREAVVPERVLLTTALHHALGRATPEMIVQAERRHDLIYGEDRGRVMVTSPTVLAEERFMLDYARNGRNACEALVTHAPVAVPDWFNDGQKKAMARLLGSHDRVTVLRGVSGAGKTSLLSAFREQAAAHGKTVFAFAPSSDASRGVLAEAGFTDATTLTTLLVSPKVQAAVRGQIILVDEASQISSPDMAKLFRVARAADARVILSGDRMQHGSVSRGSALRLLEQEAGLKPASLTDIVRQRDQYRQAVAYLSQGRMEAGFDTLDRLGWVHEIADSQQRYDRIAAEYVQATDAGKSVLVVSPTRAESETVTYAIRSALREEGRIGPDQAALLQLSNRHLTPAQRRDRVNYNDGDVVVFNQNAKGFTKGTRLTVGIDSIPLNLADRFDVYRPAKLHLARGDSLRITRNGTTADGHSVRNGQTFTVERIAKDGTLTLNNNWNLGPNWGFAEYGYCSTSHASQGKTKDVVIIVESSQSFPAASREQFYVSAGRGRSRCSIYTDQKEGLLEAIRETSDRITATELTRRLIERSRTYEPVHVPMPVALEPTRELGWER